MIINLIHQLLHTNDHAIKTIIIGIVCYLILLYLSTYISNIPYLSHSMIFLILIGLCDLIIYILIYKKIINFNFFGKNQLSQIGLSSQPIQTSSQQPLITLDTNEKITEKQQDIPKITEKQQDIPKITEKQKTTEKQQDTHKIAEKQQDLQKTEEKQISESVKDEELDIDLLSEHEEQVKKTSPKLTKDNIDKFINNSENKSKILENITIKTIDLEL